MLFVNGHFENVRHLEKVFLIIVVERQWQDVYRKHSNIKIGRKLTEIKQVKNWWSPF
jgi:hypothetical protein